MTDDNSNESGRKRARARQAEKRDEDVLGDETSGASEQSIKETPDVSATPRGEADDESGDGRRETTEEAEQPSASEESTAESEAEATEETDTSDDDVDPPTQGEAWLDELFDRMRLDLETRGRLEAGDQEYVFDVSGPDADALISRSRQSPRLMSAIQTLLTEHLGRDFRGDVVVDVGGFKQKRKSRLLDVADELADKVRQLDQTMTIAGFNRYERKVIHQRLKDVDGVRTQSVGDGIFRKLQILVD